jgi:hypothetical protein
MKRIEPKAGQESVRDYPRPPQNAAKTNWIFKKILSKKAEISRVFSLFYIQTKVLKSVLI